eukprot:TRINITY_DN34919_c0_g1_i1.p1 TRINITY_DN34919_c0_g1~~TRINITY_DN34919_c0_g1_i1.p1  ORF type:complete len:785 (+),score=169.01 TRINITY_DN34919_c0_g1_i1:86-2440(+)
MGDAVLEEPLPAAAAVGESEAAVVAREASKPSAEDAFREAEEAVAVEWVWLLMRRYQHARYSVRLGLHSLLAVCFLVAVFIHVPLRSAYEVHRSLEKQLFLTDNYRSGKVQGSFVAISDDADWWTWLEEAFLPAALKHEYHTGQNVSEVWGEETQSLVASYNRPMATLRFRQARVDAASCPLGQDAGDLVGPCWGDFSLQHQDKAAFGDAYGCQYLRELSVLAAAAGFGPHYGSEGHVVDVPLRMEAAAATAQLMKAGAWLSGATRVMAIEGAWYNGNVELTTFLRLQLDLTPGGLIRPSIVLESCRLNPYTRLEDMIALGLELLCICVLLFWALDLCRECWICGRAYWRRLWAWVELVHLVLYILTATFWVLFVLADKNKFMAVSDSTYAARPDLSQLTSLVHYMVCFAAAALCVTLFKCCRYLQVMDLFGLLWFAIQRSMVDTFCYLLVFLLFAAGFACAGHWIFGTALVEFHTWPASLATLLLTLQGGLPYGEMRQASEAPAAVFAFAWVIVVSMLLGNLFVGILSEWFRMEMLEWEQVAERLEERVSASAMRMMTEGRIAAVLRRCCRRSSTQTQRKGGERSSGRIFSQLMQEATSMLRQADVNDLSDVRAAVLADSSVGFYVADLAVHFRGDMHRTYEFAMKVRQLADRDAGKARGAGDVLAFQAAAASEEEEEKASSAAKADGHMEADGEHEKHFLRQIQKTVARLNRQLSTLTEAVRQTEERAAAQKGQTRARGTASSNASSRPSRPSGQAVRASRQAAPLVPGTVPEGDGEGYDDS